LLVFPFESGTTPFNHFGAVVTSSLDVRYTFEPFLPNVLRIWRLWRDNGEGASSIEVKLIFGYVFATWAIMSEGKYGSPLSSQTRGAENIR
jgi:hypothetical protein